MKQGEFYNMFKKLCHYYNSKIYEDEKITTMYYEKVKELNVKEFSNMCRDIINTLKFMPRVAEFDFNTGKGHYGRYYGDDFLESLYDNI